MYNTISYLYTVKVTGRPVESQKKLPSSPWSVPAVQKCSWPNPVNVLLMIILIFKWFLPVKLYRNPWCASPADHFLADFRYWRAAYRDIDRTWPPCTNSPICYNLMFKNNASSSYEWCVKIPWKMCQGSIFSRPICLKASSSGLLRSC